MENKRGSEIFLGVVGVTTLLVAIIGATFAYFSASARSENEAISVKSTTLSLGYDDVTDRLNVNMIPTAKKYADFAVFDADHVENVGECIDDNGNEICSVYEFYIGNPSKTTRMEIEGSVTSVTNEFTNLKFAIYDELGTQVAEDTFPAAGDTKKIAGLRQYLSGYAEVDTKEGYNVEKPSTYKSAVDMTLEENRGKENNVRHYTMVIWINETGELQEEQGKIFAGGLSFITTTDGETKGVSGIIAVADKAE